MINGRLLSTAAILLACIMPIMAQNSTQQKHTITNEDFPDAQPTAPPTASPTAPKPSKPTAPAPKTAPANSQAADQQIFTAFLMKVGEANEMYKQGKVKALDLQFQLQDLMLAYSKTFSDKKIAEQMNQLAKKIDEYPYESASKQDLLDLDQRATYVGLLMGVFTSEKFMKLHKEELEKAQRANNTDKVRQLEEQLKQEQEQLKRDQENIDYFTKEAHKLGVSDRVFRH
jgi:hypothetical protein